MGKLNMQQHYKDLVAHAEAQGWGVAPWVRKQAEEYEELKVTIVDDDDNTVNEGSWESLLDTSGSWWKDKIYYPLYRFWDKYFSWIINMSSYRRWWQRRTRGWDDSDTWSMDHTFSEFILPRLKRFREIQSDYKGVPSMVTAKYDNEEDGSISDSDMKLASQEWDDIVDEMIWAFDFYLDDMNDAADEDTWKRYEDGMALFAKYFRCLWW